MHAGPRHAEMVWETVRAGARAVVVYALWDRPVAACITVVIMVVPLALAYLLFSEYDIHPWQLWVSRPLDCSLALPYATAAHVAVQPTPWSKHPTLPSSTRRVCRGSEALHWLAHWRCDGWVRVRPRSTRMAFVSHPIPPQHSPAQHWCFCAQAGRCAEVLALRLSHLLLIERFLLLIRLVRQRPLLL